MNWQKSPNIKKHTKPWAEGEVVDWCRENHLSLLVYSTSRECSHLEAELWKRAPKKDILVSILHSLCSLSLQPKSYECYWKPLHNPSCYCLTWSQAFQSWTSAPLWKWHTQGSVMLLAFSQHSSAEPHPRDQSTTATNSPKTSLLFHTICRMPSNSQPRCCVAAAHTQINDKKQAHSHRWCISPPWGPGFAPTLHLMLLLSNL